MKTYFTNLLNDIKAAKRIQMENEFTPENWEEHFEEVERCVVEDPGQNLSVHCGLDKEQFPPSDQLTSDQLQSLIESLADVYGSYGVALILPEKLPVDLQYEYYLKALDNKCFVMDFGMVCMEFCEYDSSCCPFGLDYCICKDYDM